VPAPLMEPRSTQATNDLKLRAHGGHDILKIAFGRTDKLTSDRQAVLSAVVS
jgi:hypothetical protein